MTKQDAIEKLTALVARIPALEKQKRFSEDFTKWQHDVCSLLKHAFPNDSEYVKEFDEIRYTLPIHSGGTPESAFQEAFRSGLGSARAMLQSRIDEVNQFWPEMIAKASTVDTEPTNPELVFVIHGRQFLAAFHDFLRALGLKPLEWSKARSLVGRPNPYTWEIVDTALSKAGAIVALLTTDDEARLRQHLWSEHENALEKEYLFQPRQNVLFEAGVAYGRAPQRTILVRIGSHRPMSDLAGHHILQLDDSPQSRQAVADALRTAGCPVEVSGADWFQAGVFSLTEPQEAARKETEWTRARADEMKKRTATLLLYKTQLRGCTDFITAASVVHGIHSFFIQHPEYLNSANVAFLEKYPGDFKDKVLFNSSNAMKQFSLDGLKRDVELVHIEPNALA